MIATLSNQFMVFSMVAGKLGVLLLGLLLVFRRAGGRARSLTLWALVALLASALLPRALEVVAGSLRLHAIAPEAPLWTGAAIDLLRDVLSVTGLALLLQALRLGLPRKPAAAPP